MDKIISSQIKPNIKLLNYIGSLALVHAYINGAYNYVKHTVHETHNKVDTITKATLGLKNN